MNTETRRRVYRDAQAACGLAVGDRVRVTRLAESWESGWGYAWNPAMGRYLGAVGCVEEIPPDGVYVRFSPDVYYFFPYFALEKVVTPAHDFKPFDKVLVRDDDSDKWEPAFFGWKATDESHNNKGLPYPYYTTRGSHFAQCIPYEGNEPLLGTRDAPAGEEK